jgi:hypothetical protein
LTTVAFGRRVDPPLAELKALTRPENAWRDLPPWPPEAVDDRVRRVRDAHRLAISLRDTDWLSQLDSCWAKASATIDELTRRRARGEIDLGTGGPGWQPDEISSLLAEQFLVAEAPGDRAWLALANRDRAAARRHLAELATALDAAELRWRRSPEDGIRQVRAHPGAVLRVEQRALETLVR